jgi:hypothetical protein
MAIVINHNPGTYYSAHGQLLFTAYEATKAIDPVTYPNYKYVADVYIGGVLRQRMKADPDPTYFRGKFDIAGAVRYYLATALNPTASVIRSQELGTGEFWVDVQVKFGEEIDGTLTTNLTVDSSRRYYNHYNGRLTGGNSTILASYLDKPLTLRPLNTNTVELADSFCFIPYFPTDTDTITVTVKKYDSSGTIIATNSSVTYSPAAANNLQQFNVSPVAINGSIGSSFIDSAVKYYTVQFLNPNISDEPIYRFDIGGNGRYTSYTLHFLNRFGGFESYGFRRASRKNIEIERKSFKKLNYSMNSSGVISYANSNNVYSEENSTYASTYREKMKLTSDFVSDDEYLWLSDLILSPIVYLQEGAYFVPITINQSNYDFRKRVNDKLTSISLEFELPGTYNAQFR